MSLVTYPQNPFPPSSENAGGGGTPYVLPVASGETLGGVKVGSNLSINESGVLSAPTPYVLPVASAETLGGVKVGSNLSIDENGVLSASATGGLTFKQKRYIGNDEISNVIDFGNETPVFIIGIRPDPDETYAGGDYNSIMPFGWNNLQTIAIWSQHNSSGPYGNGGTNIVRISYSGNVATVISNNSRASCNLAAQAYVIDYLA